VTAPGLSGGAVSKYLNLSSGNEYVFLLMTVLLVGVGWEVFELYTGIIGTEASDVLDSGKDIVMDLVGGSCAALCIARRMV
jgi:hypothetical protein